jgi:hypothetical protein
MELKLTFLKQYIPEVSLQARSKTSRRRLNSQLPSTDRKHLSHPTQGPSAITLNKSVSSLSTISPTKDIFKTTAREIKNSPERMSLIGRSVTGLKPKPLSLDTQQHSIEQLTPPLTKRKNYSFNQAVTKIKDAQSKSWMLRHNSRNNDEGALMSFAHEFFAQLDTQSRGAVNGLHLLERLLSLGIATDSVVLTETLVITFHCKDLKHAEISLQDFLSLFRSDVITDIILQQLNEFALIERKKVKIINHMHNKNKSANIKVPSDNAISRKLSLSFVPNGEILHFTAGGNIITINEHITLIENFWKKHLKQGEDRASILTVCQMFKDLKIFQDNFESKKYIVSQLGKINVLTYGEFQKLFAKSMLKGAFVNLSKRLFEGKYAGKEISSGFQIGMYQRALLMSGIKCPNSNISVEEGQRIVKALEKFQNYPKTTYEEIRRKVLKMRGIDEKKAEKNEIKMRKRQQVIGQIRGIENKLNLGKIALSLHMPIKSPLK